MNIFPKIRGSAGPHLPTGGIALGRVGLVAAACLMAIASRASYGAEGLNRTGNRGISASVQLGVGSFQDIQLPIDPWTGSRPDGSSNVAEEVEHYGLPLRFELAKNFQQGQWSLASTISYLRIDSLLRPINASESSYSQTQLGIFPSYRFATGSFDDQVSIGGDFRRLAFMNISTGHLIDAVLPVVSWDVNKGELWDIRALIAKSLWTAFRYDNGIGFGHDQLAGSSASVMEISLATRRRIARNVWLHLGIAREDTAIDIKDVERYDHFNLTVGAAGDTSRHFRLQTETLTIGFDENF